MIRDSVVESVGTTTVYVSHSPEDATVAETIGRSLRDSGAECWLAAWMLVPGDPWQEKIEEALLRARVVVVLIGRTGPGPWQNEEMRAALDLRVRTVGERRVIPVLLPQWTGSVAELPPFLRRLVWVDLRSGSLDHHLPRLVAAVRGEGSRTSPGTMPAAAPPALRSSVPELHLPVLEERIMAIRRWVRSVQNSDGGLPSDGAGSMSCTWTTGGLLWSLWEAGESFDQPWMRRALAWVLDQANDDQGIPIVVKGDPTITEATAQTALACAAAYRDTAAERYFTSTRNLVEWLVSHQETGAGWSWRPGREPSWLASTAYALLTLATVTDLMVEAGDVRETLESGVEWLKRVRRPDLGWPTRLGDPSSPVITGLVMHTLTRLGHREYASESLGYLRSSLREDGHWPTTVDRPIGHTVPRFDDATCLLAVANAVDSLDDPLVLSGLRAMMRSYDHPHFVYADTIMHSWPTRCGLLALASLARRQGSTVVRPVT